MYIETLQESLHGVFDFAVIGGAAVDRDQRNQESFE